MKPNDRQEAMGIVNEIRMNDALLTVDEVAELLRVPLSWL